MRIKVLYYVTYGSWSIFDLLPVSYFSSKKFDLLQVTQGEDVPGGVMMSQPLHVSLSLSVILSQVNLSYLTLVVE